uniref:Uncharacterized protein n=1 Tax=Rhizophora mucronata TaxID=61149 RepID=A0A2P2PCD4_RHIMU
MFWQSFPRLFNSQSSYRLICL